MKLVADKEALSAAVSRAAQGLASSPQQPIRAGMLINAADYPVSFTCSDGEVTFSALMGEGSFIDGIEILEEGSCVVPGKILGELLRYMPKAPKGTDGIMITATEDKISFILGRACFTLGIRPAPEYPAWESPAADIPVDGDELAAGLRKVAPAASADVAHLSGVRMELRDDRLLLVATDKFKFAMVRLSPRSGTEIKTSGAAFLPSSVAARFARECKGDAAVGWDGGLISLHSAGLRVSARQVEGAFPKGWEAVIFAEPDDWHPCDTDELARAVKLASLDAEDDRVELMFGGREIAVNAGGVAQVIEGSYDGAAVTLAVGGRNLLAGLAGCGDSVNMSFTRPQRPLLLDSEGLRWLVQTRREKHE